MLLFMAGLKLLIFSIDFGAGKHTKVQTLAFAQKVLLEGTVNFT